MGQSLIGWSGNWECAYCGSRFTAADLKCHSCGAPRRDRDITEYIEYRGNTGEPPAFDVLDHAACSILRLSQHQFSALPQVLRDRLHHVVGGASNRSPEETMKQCSYWYDYYLGLVTHRTRTP